MFGMTDHGGQCVASGRQWVDGNVSHESFKLQCWWHCVFTFSCNCAWYVVFRWCWCDTYVTWASVLVIFRIYVFIMSTSCVLLCSVLCRVVSYCILQGPSPILVHPTLGVASVWPSVVLLYLLRAYCICVWHSRYILCDPCHFVIGPYTLAGLLIFILSSFCCYVLTLCNLYLLSPMSYVVKWIAFIVLVCCFSGIFTSIIINVHFTTLH